MRNIRLFRPWTGDEELANVKKAFDNAWLGAGSMVQDFERRWATYIGNTEAIALNSCTAALHLALDAYDFPPGSKVLVPEITFVATAHAVLYNKLEPVFVDVDPVELTISVEDLKRKWDSSCVAVIPVHLGGHAAQMDQIMQFAREKALVVIEDCANCAGGKYRGRYLGTIGDMGCFSFEEKKNMTTGDGGMLSLNDKAKGEKIRRRRWLGIDRDTWKRAQLGQQSTIDPKHWYYEVGELGYKYGMNDLAAAIGLAQLDKLDYMNKRRAELISRYLMGISSIGFVKPAFPYKLDESGYWLFSIRVSPEKRDRLMVFLGSRGIATGLHFMPLTLHPLYKPFANSNTNALEIWQELITLPLHLGLSNEDIDYIVQTLNEFAKQ